MSRVTRLRPAVAGDIDDVRRVRLDGVENLGAAVSVVAHVWRRGGASVELDAAVVDASARIVAVELGDADGWLALATPDEYQLEVQVTFGDGSVLTWPDDRPMSLIVRAEGDPDE